MGTNVALRLPAGVRMRDVANVIGTFIGLPKYWEESSGSKWIKIKSISRKSSTIPEMAYIDINLTDVNTPIANALRKSDGNIYELTYHFEGDGHAGPSLIPKSTAAKIALCKAVVLFFGGTLDYNDSDAVDVNIKVQPRNPLAPTNGKPWNDFHEAIYNIKPLDDADIKAVARWAAY